MFIDGNNFNKDNTDTFRLTEEEDEKLDLSKYINLTDEGQKLTLKKVRENFLGSLSAVKDKVGNIAGSVLFPITNKVNDFVQFPESLQFQIAKFYAENNYPHFKNIYKKFIIKNPQYLFEIAKATIYNNYLDEHINNEEFKIVDQNHLFELAKSDAELNNISRYIRSYKIKDINRRFEIAKIAAVSGFLISEYIHNYELNSSQLYEVAKIVLNCNNDYFLLRYIHNYKLNEKQLMEIAKKAILKDPTYADTLGHIGFTQSQRMELFLALCAHSPHEIYNYIKYFKYDEDVKLDAIFDVYLEYKHLSKNDLVGIKLMIKPTKEISFLLLGDLWKTEFDKLPDSNQQKLYTWIGFYLQCYILALKKTCDEVTYSSVHKRINGSEISLALMKLRNPQKRFQLTEMLFQNIYSGNNEYVELYENLSKWKSFNHKNVTLFRLLLTPLIHAYSQNYPENFSVYKFLKAQNAPMMDFLLSPLKANAKNSKNWDKILIRWEKVFTTLSSSVYKDATAQKVVINSLYALLEDSNLNMYEKSLLVLSIFADCNKIKEKKAKGKAINRNLSLLEAIIQSGNSNALKEIILKNNGDQLKEDYLQECLKKTFTSIIGEIRIQNFADKFEQTFLKARQPLAFFTYASRLQNLPEDQKLATLPYLRAIFKSVLEGTYLSLRYQCESQDHLSTVFSWKEGTKKIWIQNNTRSLKSLMSESDQKIELENSLSIKQYIKLRMNSDHIDPTKYYVLNNFLKNSNTPKIDEFIQKVQEREEKLFENETNLFEEQRLHLRFEKTILLLMDSHNSIEENQSKLNEAIKLIDMIYPQGHQIRQDLESLKKLLSGEENTPRLSVDTLMVEETDAWEDLLLSGTEVLGSCQNINGDSNLNKCLLDYILDGKNKMIALKDSSGTILVRAIIRLLWDSVLEKPVLYRERIYQNNGVPQKGINALDEMCKMKANALGIAFVSASSEDCHKPYPNDLESLNGRAPFEYVDAGSLGSTNGKFTIAADSIAYI